MEKDSAIDQKDDNNADFDRHNDHRSVFLFGEIRGQPKGIEQPFDKNNSRSSGYAFHFYHDLFEEIILGQSHKTLEILLQHLQAVYSVLQMTIDILPTLIFNLT